MAYSEYLDLFILAQDNPDALYYIVSFDTVNSKQIPVDKRRILQDNIYEIMRYVYGKLLDKEKELNRQVVIKDGRFIRPWDQKTLSYNGNFIDPSVLGDNFQFTVLRDTVSKDEIVEWVNEMKRKLNIDAEFFISDAYYETNEYKEGSTKLYRGYCLQILEALKRKDIQEKIKKLGSKRGIANE